MDVQTALTWLRARESQLQSQIERAQRELREVSAAVRCVERLAAKYGAAPPEKGLFDQALSAEPEAGGEAPQPEPAAKGVPLSERKVALLRCLTEKGPMTRRSILSATGMPPGSLSALLSTGREEGWLVRGHDGTWKAA